MLLKQSTTRNVVVLMIDATDHISGKTGLTLTITASKDAAAFASITPTVTELVNGWYKLALTTAHTDTKGDLALHITGTGADATDKVWQVVTDLPGDTVATATNLTNLPSIPANWITATGITAAALNGKGDWNIGKTGYSLTQSFPANFSDLAITVTTGRVTVGTNADKTGYALTGTQTIDITGNITGNLTGSVGSVTGAVGSVTAGVTVSTNNDKTGYALTSGERSAVADALLDRDMATGTDSGSPTVRTPRQALRFLRNKWSLSGTTLTVTKEDDITATWTSTVTATAGADPITASDPA